MLQPVLPIIFALLAVTALAALGARRTHIPDSIFLVLVGLAIGFVPGIPRIALRPDLVMSLLLPPLLYRAGVNMSWRGFKANLRPILLYEGFVGHPLRKDFPKQQEQPLVPYRQVSGS